MNIFTLSDPHLSFYRPKPMDVFGAIWRDHEEKMAACWQELVGPDDKVIIAGDISWALTLEQAIPDLAWLDRLPGKKIILRGNHDYWWSTTAKMKKVTALHGITTLTFLRYEALRLDKNIMLIGSRGWNPPGEGDDPDNDQVIYDRELARIDLAYQSAVQKMNKDDSLIAAVHFPPQTKKFGPTPLTARLEQYGVKLCLYGHVHGAGRGDFTMNKTVYRLTAADYLQFCPLKIIENGRLLL